MTRRRKKSAPVAANDDVRIRRAEVKRLKDMGAEVVTDRQDAIVRATILDAVDMMQRAGVITPEQAGHVRKLEAMIGKTHDQSSSSLSSLDRVGGGDVTSRTMNAIIRHTDAAKDLERRRRLFSRLTWNLLREVCDGNLLITRWRAVVERHTGEKGDKAQAGILRQAIRDLEDVENQLVRCAANDAERINSFAAAS